VADHRWGNKIIVAVVVVVVVFPALVFDRKTIASTIDDTDSQ
jgi:hypothetical protein